MAKTKILTLPVLFCLLFVVACGGSDEPDVTQVAATQTPIPATVTPLVPPTATPVVYPQTADEITQITIAMDAPARNPVFGVIESSGELRGFDPDVVRTLASQLGAEANFVVTPYDGMLESVARGEFDVAVSALRIPDVMPEGIAFTQPYLEVGQVLVVRANEEAINNYAELPAAAPIGVAVNSDGEQVVRQIIGRADDTISRYASTGQALQALINNEVGGVVMDHESALLYVDTYYQQLRIAGGAGREAWISHKAYGIAVAAANTVLFDQLNQAIGATAENNRQSQQTWLIEQERLIAGQSLIGTLDREFVIGVIGDEINLDPSGFPEPLSWEIKTNTMGGLVGFTPDNQLVPVLAEDLPLVSPDGREYTFRLRSGLTFPDGSPLTAADVKYSLDRPATSGNFMVKNLLRDANIDGFPDNDAVQVIDDLTVKILLDDATSYFLSYLATPPYFIASQNCLPLEATPNTTCGGIGPYSIVAWEQGQQLRMEANPQWPLDPPLMGRVQIIFYDSAAEVREALQLGAIDVAWQGFPYADMVALSAQDQFTQWEGATIFKSYIVFNHAAPPWNNPLIREAAALALDREALADLFQGLRDPLYSPVPDGVPGAVATQPTRDLARAKEILEELGYTAEEPVFAVIDYVDDGRYSTIEAQYAAEIERQLEQTGLFVITVSGSGYLDGFRTRTASCESGAFIFGWPSVGQPPNYIDPAHWMNFFVYNTETLCSNYDNAQMSAAVSAMEILPPTNPVPRNQAYEQIQTLWADSQPTLDLTQEKNFALSLSKVTGLEIDAMGLLRYDRLEK